MAFDNCGGEDGDDVGGELADVVRHAQQHPRTSHVLTTPAHNTQPSFLLSTGPMQKSVKISMRKKGKFFIHQFSD